MSNLINQPITLNNLSSAETIDSSKINTTSNTKLAELAKSAQTAVESEKLESISQNKKEFISNNSFKENYIRSSASVTQQSKIKQLAQKENISADDLEALYKGSAADSLYADLATAAVLFEKIQPFFTDKLRGKDSEFFTNFQNAMIAANYKDFKESLEPVNTVLSQIERTEQNNELLDTIQDIFTTKAKALHQIDTAICEINLPRNISKEDINLNFVNHDKPLLGQGVMIYAEETLKKQHEQTSILNKIQTVCSNKFGLISALEINCTPLQKEILKTYSQDTLKGLTDKLNSEATSLNGLSELKKQILSDGEKYLLKEDFTALKSKIATKIAEECKKFCLTSGISPTFLSATEQSGKFFEILERTNFSDSLFNALALHKDCFDILCSASAADKEKIQNMIKNLAPSIVQKNDLTETFISYAKELISDDTVKNTAINQLNVLQYFTAITPLLEKLNAEQASINPADIKFSDLRALVNSMYGNEKSLLNDIDLLLINTAHKTYQLESGTNVSIDKDNNFYAQFGEHQEKVKTLCQKYNANAFKNTTHQLLAEITLLGTVKGINLGLLRGALLASDADGTLNNKLYDVLSQLLNISKTTSISLPDLVNLVHKQFSATQFGQYNQTIYNINNAEKYLDDNYENFIAQPDFQKLMSLQNHKKPEETDGETLAITLLAIQRTLARDLEDLSDYQLEQLSLTKNDINNLNKLEQALVNNKDMLDTTFEYAVLVNSYLKLKNQTVSQEQLLKAREEFNFNDQTLINVSSLLSMNLSAKIDALSSLKVFSDSLGITIDNMSSSSFFKNSSDSKIIKKQFEILCNAQNELKTDKNNTAAALKAETARKNILSFVNGTKEHPNILYSDFIIRTKKHKQQSNTEVVTYAFNKATTNSDRGKTAIQPIYKSLAGDIVTRINHRQQIENAKKAAQTLKENEIENISKDSEKALSLCKTYAYLLACSKFGYQTREDLLNDFIKDKEPFNEPNNKTEFKNNMISSLIALGFDNNVASAIVTNELDQASSFSLALDTFLSKVNSSLEQLKAINILPEARKLAQIQNYGEIYQTAANTFSKISPNTRAAIDAQSGISVNVVGTESLEVDVELALTNGIVLARTNAGQPRISMDTGIIAGVSANFDVMDIIDASVSAQVSGKSILTLDFASDSDAFHFLAGVLSGLADKKDLLTAEKAYISSQANASFDISASLDVSSILNSDDTPIDTHLDGGISFGGSLQTERGQTYNTYTMEGFYSINANASLELTNETAQSIAERATKYIGIEEQTQEATSSSFGYGVKVAVIAQTDITSTKINNAEIVKTLTDTSDNAIDIFAEENKLSPKTVASIKETIKNENAVAISLHFACENVSGELKPVTGLVGSMAELPSKQGKLIACDITVSKQKEEQSQERDLLSFVTLKRKTESGLYQSLPITIA